MYVNIYKNNDMANNVNESAE